MTSSIAPPTGPQIDDIPPTYTIVTTVIERTTVKTCGLTCNWYWAYIAPPAPATAPLITSEAILYQVTLSPAAWQVASSPRIARRIRPQFERASSTRPNVETTSTASAK